jgi:SpoIID/LytB domain protein
MRPKVAVAATVLAVAGGTVVAAGLVTPERAGAVEDYPAPADGVFTLRGRGYGHGVGMSQYGARNAANRGLTGSQILAFYYPGTTTVAQPADSVLRVRLTAASPTALPVQGATGLVIRDAATGSITALPSTTARYRIVLDATAQRVQSSADGGVTWSPVILSGGATATGPLVFEGVPEIRLYFPDGTSRGYEGKLSAVRKDATTLHTVNTLGLDPYVNGVLGREMPSTWPGAALRAQAVAARTYAVFERDTNSPTAAWDICDSTQCQVYGGRRLYSGGAVTDLQPATVRTAVAHTARQVRTYAGAAIFAQFGASNGGQTVANTRFPYLVAKADPYDPLDGNPYATWTATLSVARLAQCYPAAGTVQRLTVLTRDGNGDWGGRLVSVRLTGLAADGSATQLDVPGDKLRSCGGMRSTYATVTSGLRVTVGPAGLRNPDGSIDLFARGPLGDVHHRRYLPGSGWQAWQSHGGSIVDAPTVERTSSGALRVWARSPDDRLVGGTWQAGAWSGWSSWGGPITSRPASAVLPDGTRYVVARGARAELTYATWTAAGGFLGWRSLGGGILASAGPGITATGPGSATVAVVGGGGQVYVKSRSDGGWASSWTPIGGSTASDVALAAPSAGVLDVYVRAADTSKALHTRRAVNGLWGVWQNAGGGLADGPWADVVEGAGRTEIWIAGTNGSVYLRKRSATWGPWERQPA